MSDLNFYFDPVCPFAWMTSKWVRQVQRQRAYDVEWRFISLRLLNNHVDYDAHFPPEYEAGHNAGLHLLRVAAATRDAHGVAAVDALQHAYGARVFEADEAEAFKPAKDDVRTLAEEALAVAGLPSDLAAAWADEQWDTVLQAETDEALALSGKDVGTPIIHFQPPDGVAFFGPVISRLPDDAQAAELWDHVVGLATFPSFAELKRSLREMPQLPAFGIPADEAGTTEDWHAGSRRQKR